MFLVYPQFRQLIMDLFLSLFGRSASRSVGKIGGKPMRLLISGNLPNSSSFNGENGKAFMISNTYPSLRVLKYETPVCQSPLNLFGVE
jgi:hypothetical protein